MFQSADREDKTSAPDEEGIKDSVHVSIFMQRFSENVSKCVSVRIRGMKYVEKQWSQYVIVGFWAAVGINNQRKQQALIRSDGAL